MSTLTIGQVARRVGIGIETIRFYERKGLIEEPPRRESGYRQYGEGDIERLVFIQHAKTLGFSLKEKPRVFACWIKTSRSISPSPYWRYPLSRLGGSSISPLRS